MSNGTFVIRLPGNFGVRLEHFWTAFVILFPSTFVILLPGTFGALFGHFWSTFGKLLPGIFVILSPSTFVILFLVLLEYFQGTFGMLFKYFCLALF